MLISSRHALPYLETPSVLSQGHKKKQEKLFPNRECQMALNLLKDILNT